MFFRLALPDDMVELDLDEGPAAFLVMRTKLVSGARLGDMARRAATAFNSWRASGCKESSRRFSEWVNDLSHSAKTGDETDGWRI